MKLKILTLICLTAAFAAPLCACGSGQTGGGQNLNRQRETQTVQTIQDESDDSQCPDGQDDCRRPDGDCGKGDCGKGDCDGHHHGWHRPRPQPREGQEKQSAPSALIPRLNGEKRKPNAPMPKPDDENKPSILPAPMPETK